MPDISELNGNAIGNLSEVDGLAKASILDIDGVTVTDPGINPSAPTSGFLFTYSGSSAAFSVRQLNNNADQIMRVRRASDNVEADVGFDAGELKLTSPISNTSDAQSYTDLADFVDHTGTPTDAFCRYWYDQTGNQNHGDQSFAGSQPKVYDSTIPDLVKDNGKPALSCDIDRFELGSTISLTSGYSAIHVSQQSARDSASFGTNFNYNYVTLYQSANVWFYHNTAGRTISYIVPLNTQQLHWLNWTGSTVGIGIDGGALSTGALSASASINRLLNASGNAQLGWRGLVQEMLIYPTDQIAAGNRTGMETNINSEYLTYQPTDAPTSGLLATYTGAAAAYSVRQLSNKAVIAMTIRRDSDGKERNIGFDSNGDLDTTAISAFCETANGYVTRWWDQSTNGNHADQSNPSYQPQIYNGTAVITSGTTTVRPSLQFETSATAPTANTGFDLSFSSTLSQPFTASITTRDITTGTDEMCWMDNGNTTGLNGIGILSDGSPDTLILSAGSVIGGTAQKDSDMLLFGVFNTTNSELFKNNSSIGSGNAGTRSLDGLTIGGLRPGINQRFGIHGNVQEWILWDTAQGSTNRNGIHSDTNTYFGIY